MTCEVLAPQCSCPFHIPPSLCWPRNMKLKNNLSLLYSTLPKLSSSYFVAYRKTLQGIRQETFIWVGDRKMRAEAPRLFFSSQTESFQRSFILFLYCLPEEKIAALPLLWPRKVNLHCKKWWNFNAVTECTSRNISSWKWSKVSLAIWKKIRNSCVTIVIFVK